ncbi:MAG: hypothetical protein ABSE75_05720 [Acidimicrobiales bacterium]|jgi:hypothetical protein
MLLVILGLLWVAILVPVVVRRFRDSGTEKSIHSFHQEHEMLSRQEYSVSPAHRLDPEPPGEAFQDLESRPRLTVVHEDDTYRSLETRSSWDEWEDDYDYERDEQPANRAETANRYVTAYSSVPNEHEVKRSYVAPMRRASMKTRRQSVFLLLAASAVALSGLSIVVGYSLLEDLALLAWMGLIFYVALALFAVSQGFLFESSLPIRIPQGRTLATIEPIYYEDVEEFDSEFYDENDDSEWRRESPSRYAVG